MPKNPQKFSGLKIFFKNFEILWTPNSPIIVLVKNHVTLKYHCKSLFTMDGNVVGGFVGFVDEQRLVVVGGGKGRR